MGFRNHRLYKQRPVIHDPNLAAGRSPDWHCEHEDHDDGHKYRK
jgi:hypothetical protein